MRNYAFLPVFQHCRDKRHFRTGDNRLFCLGACFPAFAGLIDIALNITFSLTARSCAMFDTYASLVASSLNSSCDLVAVCDLLDQLGINYVRSVPLWFITLREPTKHPWYGTARFWDWSSIPPKDIVSGMNSNRPVSSSVIKQIE